MRIPPFDRGLAADLLGEPGRTPLSAYDVAARAHRRWNRKEFVAAATLFALAAEREQAAPQDPDQFPNYAVRAAITLSLDGQPTLAEPTLRDATELDWAAAGLPQDAHMVQWAFTRLLLDSSTGFGELFDQAVARCSDLGMSYPSIHPQQEELLSVAIDRAEWAVVAHLTDLMAKRRPLSRAARAQLKEAQALLAAARQTG